MNTDPRHERRLSNGVGRRNGCHAVPGGESRNLLSAPHEIEYGSHTAQMKTLTRILLLVAGVIVGASAAEKPLLDEHLEPFRPFLGKTWKGHFKNSTPEKPQVDVSRWE